MTAAAASEPAANRGGLRRRLGRAFLVQALTISVVAALSIWAAAFTLEEVLIKQALEQEAEHYFALRDRLPDAHAPNTRNLTGYLMSARDVPAHNVVPAELAELGPGFHRLDSDTDVTVVLVADHAEERLALVFDGDQVRELSVFFGLLPLGLVIGVIYFAAYLSYRAATHAVSPVEWLAREVQELDPEKPDASAFSPERLPGQPDSEVLDLAEALARFADRTTRFAERERNFTRDASHELRSPLTVVRLAAGLLEADQGLSPNSAESVRRIHRAANDMEELTEAFLLLARESEHGLTMTQVSVNAVVAEEVERARALVGDRRVRVAMEERSQFTVQASARVLAVLLGNLLRNAVNYTDEGEVIALVSGHRVEIRDSGAGMRREDLDRVFTPFYRGEQGAATVAEADTLAGDACTPAAERKARAPGKRARGGHGVGLTIVKRLSDRFGWPLHIESEPGRGTRVVVEFPQAKAVAP